VTEMCQINQALPHVMRQPIKCPCNHLFEPGLG
jgi:hypothetical protein